MTELDVRYSAFPGSFRLLIDGENFSLEAEWVPLLDLLYILRSIVRSITTSSPQVYHYTENDEWLRFKLKGRSVLVEGSHTGVVGKCPLTMLLNVVERSYNDFGSYVRAHYPSSLENAFIARLLVEEPQS